MHMFRSWSSRLLVLLGVGAGLLAWRPLPAAAQFAFGGGQSVGGVKIDPEGLLKNATDADADKLLELRKLALQEVPGDLKRPATLRKVSLRRLEAALTTLRDAGQPMEDAMRYLAGLQRIRYVFVYPEQNDIVIAGYAESWKLDQRGNVVGSSTGRAVMLLDDLVVALRTVRAGAGEISCSIDPTQEGLARLQEYAAKMQGIDDPQREAQTIEQLLGQQTISITGVAPTTHFARVMVAADYRMKRLGMKLDPPPIPGLPSYVDMIRPSGRGMQAMTPRWWMVPSYDPLMTDADGLAWEIRGASVKALTEETLFGKSGSKSKAAKVNPVAQAWANNFSSRYVDLALKDPIFAQLRNCMDLAVLAALVVKQDLTGKSGYQMPLWLNDVNLPVADLNVPRTTDTQVSLGRKSNYWVVTASGGVQLELDKLVSSTQKSDQLAPARQQAVRPADSQNWWWD